MFRTLQDFFQNLAAPSSDGTSAGHAHVLRLAAAVLLVEVMRPEPGVGADEREAVRSALTRRFSLAEGEVANLIRLAETEAGRANDFFHFTSRLNDQCSQPDKVALVEAMWQVAYADGLLDANENHVISKIAGLLHVTHGEYIAAKMRAKEAAGV
jgi:uncharacterized tellurite resistance protein B-like protein